jgi:Protein of unknown function (DUF2934)
MIGEEKHMSRNPTMEKPSQRSLPDAKGDEMPDEPNKPENLIEQHSLTEARSVTAEQRHDRIAAVAFRLAESRGFAPGGEFEDWLRAESEVEGQSTK